MSTFTFSIEEILELLSSVLHSRDLEHRLITDAEYGHHVKLSGKAPDRETIENDIAYFFQRLYVANQAAEILTYYKGEKGNEVTLTLLRNSDLAKASGYLTRKELERKLSSLHYNCYINGGFTFLSKDDEEKLTGWIHYLQDLMINRVE